MDYHYFNETFDDDFYLILDESDEVDLFDIIKPKFGDLVVYNYETDKFDTLPKERCGIENDKAIIGIVVKVYNDMKIDVLMKNFLTTEKIMIPMKYRNKLSYIPAYLKDLFDRYCNKYLRTSIIDITLFKYQVPSIGLLDYVSHNFSILNNTLSSVWGEERCNTFFERLYTNGLFSIHKGRYYKWIPKYNDKREIKNFDIFDFIEFLPVFTLQYN